MKATSVAVKTDQPSRRAKTMPIKLKVTSPPAEQPITLSDARADRRIVDGVHDDALLRYIDQATDWAQQYTARTLITTTYQLALDYFPVAGKSIVLPRPPLQSVSSITYIDTAGASKNIDLTKVYIDTFGRLGAITPIDDHWPSTDRRPNAVIVEFIAGYGDDASSIPSAIQAAITLLVGDLFSNRENTQFGGAQSQMPFGVENLLQPYRIDP